MDNLLWYHLGKKRGGGGSGGGGGIGNGAYNLRVIDYDGTVLAEKNLNEGEVFNLPDAPTHDRLVFDGWSSSTPLVENTVVMPAQNVLVGATYATESGAIELDVEFNPATGLTVTLNTVFSGATSMDWGDGTTGNPSANTSHTYSEYGEYTIKIFGASRILDGTVDYGGIVRTASGQNYVLKRAFIGKSVASIGSYAFFRCHALETVVMPNSVSSVSDHMCTYCRNITQLVLPSAVTSLGDGFANACQLLKYIVVPHGVTTIGTSAFMACSMLESIALPDSLKNLSGATIFYLTGLCELTIPDGVTTLGKSLCGSCGQLKRVVLPKSVTDIGESAFSTLNAIREIDFSSHESIPTLQNKNAFSSFPGSAKIKVPSALLSQWKTATNWSTYADYMVGV